MKKLQISDIALKRIVDNAKKKVIANKNGYQTFATAQYYNGILLGFINGVNMDKDPIVTFSGSLTYFAIRGKENCIDTNPKILVSKNGNMQIYPSNPNYFINGETCIIQTSNDAVFILEYK